MAKTALGKQEVNTSGELPTIGSTAPDFALVKPDLSEVTLANYLGQKVILNIYPSIDTDTCALSTVRFNKEAASLEGVRIICVSKDSPFAFKRYCAVEGISNLDTVSAFRDGGAFGKAYGVEMIEGIMKGFFARSVVVLDEVGKVIYTEIVPQVGMEPDYEKALAALG